MKKITCLILCMLLAACSAFCETAGDTLSEMYAKAELSMIQGNYLDAASEFDKLKTYSDASKMAVYCRALNAAEVEGRFSDAINSFDMLEDFKDSSLQSIYFSARALQSEAESLSLSSDISGLKASEEKYMAAAEIYNTILHFSNSEENAEYCMNKYLWLENEIYQRIYGFSTCNETRSPDMLKASVSAYSLSDSDAQNTEFLTYSVSDELFLLVERYIAVEGPCIYNRATGEKCYLYSRDEDLDLWKQLLRKNEKYRNMDSAVFNAVTEKIDVMKECFSSSITTYFELYRSGRMLYWSNDRFSVLIDMITGETRPLDIFAFGLTDNKSLMVHERSADMINIFAPDQRCIRSIDLSGFDPFDPICFRYHDAHIACIARDSELSMATPMEYISSLLDENGNRIASVSLGRYRALMGPERLLFSQSTNTALVYGASSPAILVQFDKGLSQALVSDGSTIKCVPPDELCTEDGTIKSSMPLLFPIGLSGDGTYALFCDLEHACLIMMDLNTKESNCIMNTEEMESLSFSPIELSNMHWNGSSCLFSVVNRFLKLNFEN